jgi:cytochrome c553
MKSFGLAAKTLVLTIFLSLVTSLIVVVDAGRSFAADKVSAKRGEYLVNLGSCNDCHSPKIMTPQGPVPDRNRLLSGQPAGEKLAPVPEGLIGPDKWGALCNNNLSAWVGPWGMSFASNLSPDNETGIGVWNEDLFIKVLRTGKFMGAGRPILPPMPWQNFAKLTDNDLKSIFAYLKSLKPIKNRVPEPVLAGAPPK